MRWLLVFTTYACFAQQQQIEQLASPAAAEAYGAKLLKQSREPGESVAAVWVNGSAAAKKSARLVLNEMAEAALHPLLEANGTLDPQEQVWRMTMLVETIGDLRESAARALDKQLDNKQPAPLPTILGAEGRRTNRRVCDEAYVQMSRLVATDSTSASFLAKMQQFQQMPETARDAEIQRARQQVGWRSLVR